MTTLKYAEIRNWLKRRSKSIFLKSLKKSKKSKVEGKRKVKSDNWKFKTQNSELERKIFETIRQISQIQIDQMEYHQQVNEMN
jgi:hypothetical protein